LTDWISLCVESVLSDVTREYVQHLRVEYLHNPDHHHEQSYCHIGCPKCVGVVRERRQNTNKHRTGGKVGHAG